MPDETKTESLDDLEKRVAQAREARLAKQRAAEEPIARKRLEEELKLTEIEATEGLLDKEIKALFSPHDGSMCVVRKPSPAAWQRFQTKVLAEKVTVADLYDLIRTSLVYPDKGAFQTMCDLSPGLLSRVANAVSELAGVGAGDVAGK